MRGDEGYLLALAYSPSVVTGAITRSRARSAVAIRRVYCAGRAGICGERRRTAETECEMVNGFIDPPDEPPHFSAATDWCSA